MMEYMEQKMQEQLEGSIYNEAVENGKAEERRRILEIIKGMQGYYSPACSVAENGALISRKKLIKRIEE